MTKGFWLSKITQMYGRSSRDSWSGWASLSHRYERQGGGDLWAKEVKHHLSDVVLNIW
jgi:hypothetical protein